MRTWYVGADESLNRGVGADGEDDAVDCFALVKAEPDSLTLFDVLSLGVADQGLDYEPDGNWGHCSNETAGFNAFSSVNGRQERDLPLHRRADREALGFQVGLLESRTQFGSIGLQSASLRT